jgi:hypothetical protein
MPYLAIHTSSAPHRIKGWAETEQAARQLYPGTQILAVNDRVVQLIGFGVGIAGLGLAWSSGRYRTVPGYSAPGEVTGLDSMAQSLPEILRNLEVSTLEQARDMVCATVVAWTGDIDVQPDRITFLNSQNDPRMDEIAQAVLSHPYIVEHYFVGDGVAGQYTFRRAPDDEESGPES